MSRAVRVRLRSGNDDGECDDRPVDDACQTFAPDLRSETGAILGLLYGGQGSIMPGPLVDNGRSR